MPWLLPSSKVMTCHIQNKLLMVPDSGIRGMFSITSIRLSDTVFVNTADNNCLPPQVGDPPSPMASYCFDKCQMSLAETDWLTAEQLCGQGNISHYSQSRIHPITAQEFLRMCRRCCGVSLRRCTFVNDSSKRWSRFV